MKIDRLIGILSILLQQDKVTASELAEKFEVSRRTIVRDIEDICKAGIPIVTAQGRGGGISVMEGFKIDRTALSREEMGAILAGLQSLDSVSGTNRYRQLMDKLDAGNAVSAGGNIIIDLSTWDKNAVSPKIELIKAAMERHEKISFRYFSPERTEPREIEPYKLIFQWSSWYVWGFCEKRRDYRMFKLTRMTGLTGTGEVFEPRDIPEYTCDKLRHTKGEISAKVKFDKSVKWRIVDEFGSELVDDFGADNYMEDKDGNIVIEFTWSDVPSFFSYILGFRDSAEILEPKEYRKGFAELLKKISEKYKL